MAWSPCHQIWCLCSNINDYTIAIIHFHFETMPNPFVDPKTILKDGEGKEISASSLWTDSPALVVVLRRPGCRTLHACTYLYL